MRKYRNQQPLTRKDNQPLLKHLFAMWHRAKRKEWQTDSVTLGEEFELSSTQISAYENGRFLPKDLLFYIEMMEEYERRMKGR